MKRVSSLGLLPSLLAIAETRSPLRAADMAGVSPSTMYRHINALEAKIGAQLFDRLPEGWQPTAAGADAIRLAESVERSVHDLESRLRVKNSAPQGALVISVSDDLAWRYLAPHLLSFRERYPAIVPTVRVSNSFADLSRNEADVAIRPSQDPGETLIGRKVGEIRHAIYAARSYLARNGRPAGLDDLADHDVCDYDDAIKSYDVARWLAAHRTGYRIAARFNTLSAMAAAVEAGVGLGILPCYIGDALSEVVPVLDVEDGLPAEIWLVAHRSRKRDPNVRAFFDYFSSALQLDAPLFRGRSHAVAPKKKVVPA